MPANVLKSLAATHVSVRIVRAFVTLRGMLAEHAEFPGSWTIWSAATTRSSRRCFRPSAG
jgi:hypothetical protein